MRLRFPVRDIERIAEAYSCPPEELALMGLRPSILKAGALTKKQLRRVARWKSPRSAGHIDVNPDSFVKEVTAFALRTPDERARVEVLTLLDGVLWPTASVILHLYHRDPYPILDFRALWSVSTDVPNQYSFDFWMAYVKFCRSVAARAGVPMRTLDRALWQYSKDNESRDGA